MSGILRNSFLVICCFAVMIVAIALVGSASTARAAITWSGDVDPLDPTKWMTLTLGTIGKTTTGSVTVNSGSTLYAETLYVGDSGSGTLNIFQGGMVNVRDTTSVACNEGSTGKIDFGLNGGTLTTKLLMASPSQLSGTGKIVTNGLVSDIDLVFDSTHGLTQTILLNNITISLSQTSSSSLGAGYLNEGTMSIRNGVNATSTIGYIGYKSGSQGNVVVDGNGSSWTTSNYLYVGNSGRGELDIVNGGKVTSGNIYFSGYIGYAVGSTGIVRVDGNGSTWNDRYMITVGFSGNGSLEITDGGTVNSRSCIIGYYPDLIAIATVNGTGSNWTNTGSIDIGLHGSGALNITNGGVVSVGQASIGSDFGSSGAVKVEGIGSKWINNFIFYVGEYGSGTLDIKSGGWVSNHLDAYVGYYKNSSGTATVTGRESQWINDATLHVGLNTSGTLNIGNENDIGGKVVALTLELAMYDLAIASCNLNGAGTLQVGNITKGVGLATFNWNDGTIKNYNTTTDLSVSGNLAFNLSSTGTHSFNIDTSRTGTIDALIADATSGGTLNKIGQGTLILTAANTYSGATTVEDGRFKVTGSFFNTSGITVEEKGILELARVSGSATAATLNIDNVGTVLISAGSQKVDAINGTGNTQVTGSATLTAQSIVQNTLTIGGTGASSMNAVPEPSTLLLLTLAALGLSIRRLKSK